MNTDSHRFRLGDFECIIVNDGTFAYPHPAQLFFANAPEKSLREVLEKQNLDLETWDQYVSPYPSLVVKTRDHCVLVDTGAGEMAPTTGRLLDNLQAEGIAGEDIDTVILTHAHPDHIGGIAAGGERLWPKARYVMWKDEWDFWTSSPDLSSLNLPEQLIELIQETAMRNLPLIKGHLSLVDRETEIVSGIKAVAAPGHTPGHMALLVSSGGEALLHIVDAVIHPIHVERPDWYTAFDLLPEQTVVTRRRLLEQAAVRHLMVLALHFPFPCLGHIGKQRDRWQWRAI